MKTMRLVLAGAMAALTMAAPMQGMAQDRGDRGDGQRVRHVLLLSIDGMHAVDFYNCSRGIAGVNDGNPYCPNMAALKQTGINYVATTSSKPSDSFPGLA